MKLHVLFLIAFCFFGCDQREKPDYLIKVFQGEYDEVGVKSGYMNLKGDTVIPLGKYFYCFTDTFCRMAIVQKQDGKLLGIDRNEKELFQVFWCDNGPDPFSDGLFRIVDKGKIGYANMVGQILIEPQYDCAFPFKDGKAKVTYHGIRKPDGEYTRCESEEWFYIDKSGKKVE